MEDKKLGRPSKFTPERRAAILESISNRIPYIIAAEANGICEDTLYEWIKQGRIDLKNGINSEFARFSEAIKKEELKKIKEHLDCIDSMPERWQAQAWILERRWWKLFSPNAAMVEMNKRMEKLERGELSGSSESNSEVD